MNQIEIIAEHVPPALLVVFRLGGLMIFGPVFGSPAVLVRVKVFFAFLLGLSIYPLIVDRAAIEQVMQLDLFMLAPIVAMELMIGVIIGYAASLPLVGVQTGGLVMGQQMGLGFARFFNPAIDDEADIIGQLLFFLALAGFLIVGGHEAMVHAVLASFHHIPLGQFAIDGSVLDLVVGLLLSAFEMAMRVAAPLLALIFLESVALGFIAKTVPQLNILSLGFPVRILAGFAIVAAGLHVINDVMMDGMSDMLAVLNEWIESG